jgi:chemotaxis signal transduction protein/nucleoid-associated protein YgaU
MKTLCVYNLGDLSYGIWEAGEPHTLEARDIHWLASMPAHIAGITVRDDHTVTLLDLPACLGLAPVAGKYSTYRLLALPEPVASGPMVFILPASAGRATLDAEAVFPLPEALASPVIPTYTVCNSRPIAVIDMAGLYRRVQAPDFTPRPCSGRVSKPGAGASSPPGSYRLVAAGDQIFALPEGQVESVDPARAPIHAFQPAADFIAGIGLKNGAALPVIDLARRLHLEATAAAPAHLLDVGLQAATVRLRVEDRRAKIDGGEATIRPLPPLLQSPGCRSAVSGTGGIFPVLDVAALLSDPAEPAAPAGRYTPASDFSERFGRADLGIVEFELGFGRHALPAEEVDAPIGMRPLHPLPGTKPLVAGVAEYEDELLPVIDLVRCFGHCSRPKDGWQLLPLTNGDFKALILTERADPERRLGVDVQRELPFENSDGLVYGCYPDDACVRLIFNAYAMAVYFDRIRHVDFFQALASVARKEKQLPDGRLRRRPALEPDPQHRAPHAGDDEEVGSPAGGLADGAGNRPVQPLLETAVSDTQDADGDRSGPACGDIATAAQAAEAESGAPAAPLLLPQAPRPQETETAGGIDAAAGRPLRAAAGDPAPRDAEPRAPVPAMHVPKVRPLTGKATDRTLGNDDSAGADTGETLAPATGGGFEPVARGRDAPVTAGDSSGAAGMPIESHGASAAGPTSGRQPAGGAPEVDAHAVFRAALRPATGVAADSGAGASEAPGPPSEEEVAASGAVGAPEKHATTGKDRDLEPGWDGEDEPVATADDICTDTGLFSIESIPAIAEDVAGGAIDDNALKRSGTDDPLDAAPNVPQADAADDRAGDLEPPAAESASRDPQASGDAAVAAAGDPDGPGSWDELPSIPEECVEEVRDLERCAQEAPRTESRRRKRAGLWAAVVILLLVLLSGWGFNWLGVRQTVRTVGRELSKRFLAAAPSARTETPAPAAKPSPPVPVATGDAAGGDEEDLPAPRPFQAPPLLEPGQIKIVDQDGRIVIYRVKRGDTLWGISKRYTGSGFNYPKLAEENEIEDPDLIFPKQRITVK